MNLPHKKFAEDVGITSLAKLTVALKGLIILPIITKTLGAENFGVWTQIVVTISLVVPIATLGLPYTLVRFLDAGKKREEIQEGVYSVLSLTFLIGLAISLILIGSSGPISNFFGGSEPLLIKILAFVILLECLNLVFLNVFRAFQEMGRYSLFTIIQALGEIGLIVIAVYLGFGLSGAVFSLLIARLVVFLIMGYLIIQWIGLKIPNFIKLKEYLSFGLPTVPSNISSWVVQSSDRYLIGLFLGTLFVGYYAPVFTIGNIINLLIAPLALVLPALLSKLYDENNLDEVRRYLKYSLKYFLMLTIPTVFGLSVLSKQLLTIFSTAEIAEQGYPLVPLIALSLLLWGVYSIFVQILALSKKTRVIGIIWLVAAALNLGLNIILIPRIGIMGAAITTLLAYTFAFIATWYHSAQDLRFEIDWRSILKSTLASILMLLFIRWLDPTGLSNTLATIVASAFLYGALILSLRGLNKREVVFFLGFFKIQNFGN